MDLQLAPVRLGELLKRVIRPAQRDSVQLLPKELGCGSGTCCRRLRDWHQEGIWDLMHFALLNWLARDGDIDWSRVVVDSCSVRAVCGGTLTGPNPTDRANAGANGI